MCCRAKEKPGLPPIESCPSSIIALHRYYEAKVLPTERRHLFTHFHTPSFSQPELEGKPIIMLLGQYSVGKTSFVEYLCNGKYPGADIGPEPTTDVFAHIHYAESPITIDGPALAQDHNYALKGFEMFGERFLNKLRATNFKADILQHISIIDTPGILAGKKQTESRGYDYAAIITYLAERVDKIILMFDASKLDVSDEYRDVIKVLDNHFEKVRIVLNKCDTVSPRELIQVRGALMWALGKIFTTPEVPKVYIGSFWKYMPDKTIVSKTILEDTDALLKEITDLPNTCKTRRINDVVKRAKQVRIHATIMDEMVRSQTFGFNLEKALNSKKYFTLFPTIARNYGFVLSDMPNDQDFKQKASRSDGKMWKKIDKKKEFPLLMAFLNEDISRIIAFANNEAKPEIKFKVMDKIAKPPELRIKGGEMEDDNTSRGTPNQTATTPATTPATATTQAQTPEQPNTDKKEDPGDAKTPPQ